MGEANFLTWVKTRQRPVTILRLLNILSRCAESENVWFSGPGSRAGSCIWTFAFVKGRLNLAPPTASRGSAAEADAMGWDQERKGCLRDELSVVVALLGQQLAPPTKKGPQGRVRILRNFTLIPVRPHFQADKSDADVQGAVKLKRHGKASFPHHPVWELRARMLGLLSGHWLPKVGNTIFRETILVVKPEFSA